MLASDLLRRGCVASFVLVATLERLPILVVLASLQATVGVFFGPARGALVAARSRARDCSRPTR